MYICADDDIKTKGNPGITKATEAAHAVEAKIIAPDFGANRPDGVTDFNDMAALSGKDAVTRFFTERFSETMANDYSEGDADDPDDRASEQRVYFSTPTEQHFVPPSAPYAEQSERESAGASHHPAYPRAAARPLPEPIAKPKCHFSGNEFAVVHHIWKDVPRQVSRHDESGYHHIVDEKRKVIVSKDVIELARKPRHRPDEAYAAACEHARHFWDGQMEVHGDSTHCIKAWAYATASGIQVTNYSPTDRELIEAEKIVAKLRKKMEPTFRRPSSYRPINGAKPRP
jgi:hypothetical protein